MLFYRFSQVNNATKKKYQGTGLGLDMTKNIVNFMNREISFTSKVNIGSTFYDSLPCEISKVCSNRSKEVTSNKEHEKTNTTNRCILVTDDDAVNRILIP